MAERANHPGVPLAVRHFDPGRNAISSCSSLAKFESQFFSLPLFRSLSCSLGHSPPPSPAHGRGLRSLPHLLDLAATRSRSS